MFIVQTYNVILCIIDDVLYVLDWFWLGLTSTLRTMLHRDIFVSLDKHLEVPQRIIWDILSHDEPSSCQKLIVLSALVHCIV